MKHKKHLLTLALLASTTISTAQASLFDRGNGLIYNDATQTTWVADANLFQTQAAGNNNLVTDIIAANNGVIHDTPDLYNSGTYTLSSADFSTSSGRMDWWGAQAYIGYLNKTDYAGYNNWALPSTAPEIAGINTTGSQMGELFYNELGGVAIYGIDSTDNANYNLFTNFTNDSRGYWSGSELTSSPDRAWMFLFDVGIQLARPKYDQRYAWIVRPGDVIAVPEPATFWLFSIGLMSLLGLRRRGNIG
jgi:hypothetical protein